MVVFNGDNTVNKGFYKNTHRKLKTYMRGLLFIIIIIIIINTLVQGLCTVQNYISSIKENKLRNFYLIKQIINLKI